VVTAKRDKAAALKFLKRIMKKYGRSQTIVTDGLCSYPAAMKELGIAGRHKVGRRLNNRAENSHQPFRHAAVSEHEDPAEIRLNTRPSPYPLQSGAPSCHPRSLQAETLGLVDGMARSRGINVAMVWSCYAAPPQTIVTLTVPSAAPSRRTTLTTEFASPHTFVAMRLMKGRL
jgi:DDE domain